MAKKLRGRAPPAGILLILMCLILFILKLRGISPYIVLSGSMEPALKTGGIVWVRDDHTLPAVGDIIMYKRGDSFITHRVTAREGDWYITKGDANPEADPVPVCTEEVKGKVIYSVPFAGYAVMFLKKRLFVCLFVTVLICNVWKIRKESAKEHAQNVI